MHPHLIFWDFAAVALLATLAFGLFGWREVRAGRIAAHRRAMNRAAACIGLFLVAYLAKVALLGREDLSHWSRGELALLRLHESFIAVMLLAGARARWLSRRFSEAQGIHGAGSLPIGHRRLGRTAVVAALLALVSGLAVLGTLRDNAPTSRQEALAGERR